MHHEYAHNAVSCMSWKVKFSFAKGGVEGIRPPLSEFSGSAPDCQIRDNIKSCLSVSLLPVYVRQLQLPWNKRAAPLSLIVRVWPKQTHKRKMKTRAFPSSLPVFSRNLPGGGLKKPTRVLTKWQSPRMVSQAKRGFYWELQWEVVKLQFHYYSLKDHLSAICQVAPTIHRYPFSFTWVFLGGKSYCDNTMGPSLSPVCSLRMPLQ